MKTRAFDACASWSSRLRLAAVLASAVLASAAVGAAGPVSAQGAKARPNDIFLATNGNDEATGRGARAGATDGPVATLTHALEIARAVRAASPDRQIRVLVRGGRYTLSEPILLTQDDSGTAQAPLTIEAYPGERPVFTGGVRLVGWRPGPAGTWTTALPQGDDDLAPSELYVDDRRSHRPRLPKSGYYTVAAAAPSSPDAADKGSDRFGYASGQLSANWPHFNDIEVTFLHAWTSSTFHLLMLDASTNVAQVYGRTRSARDWDRLKTGVRFRLENVRAAFGTPGDFIQDPGTATLSYQPRSGESIAGSVIVAPKLEHLLILSNATGRGAPVQYITLRGLAFTQTARHLPALGIAEQQAAVDASAALVAVGAQHVLFDRVSVRETGGYGLAFGPGCKFDQVFDSTFADLGAGGIMVGHLAPSATASRLLHPSGDASVSDIAVRNNVVAGGGRLSPGAVGVWVGKAKRVAVVGNDISDLYYSGVSLGWTWGYGESGTSDNHVEYNHIHNIGQGVLSDLAGVYLLGRDPGAVVAHNVIHDVTGATYGGFGFNADEGSAGVLFDGNLVYRTSHEAFAMNFGEDNVVRHNIFALSGTSMFSLGRGDPHRTATIEQNVVFSQGDIPLFQGAWKGADVAENDNLYWSTGALPRPMKDIDWDDWKGKVGRDTRSLFIDPRFKDPQGGDFHVAPGSVLPTMGIEAPSAAAIDRAVPAVDRSKIEKAF